MRGRGDGKVTVEVVLTGRVPGAAVDEDRPQPTPGRERGLPGLGAGRGAGGVWVTQYAWALSRSVGPVAVLRLGVRVASLWMVDAPYQPSSGADSADARGLLQALKWACGRGRSGGEALGGGGGGSRLLVDVSDSLEGLSGRALVAARAWTVLTGADATSVAGSYSLLKRAAKLTPSREAAAARRVGAMVVGSDPGVAMEGHGMLDTLARPLVGRVSLVGVQKRMVPVAVAEVATSVVDDATWDELAEVLFLEEARRPAMTPRARLAGMIPTAEPLGATAA